MAIARGTRKRHPGEAAFTLIELVVGFVLLALLFAAIFPALSNLTTRSDRSSSTSIASSDTGIAARMFESDMRQIRGDRGTDDVFGNTSSTIASLARTGPESHDIVSASPTRLVVNADVLDIPGIERVTWELLTSSTMCGSGNTWCFRRTVADNPLATTTHSQEVVSRGSGTVPSSSTCTTSNTTADDLPPLASDEYRVFCYQEAISASYDYQTWTSACTQQWRKNTPTPNAAEVTVSSPSPGPTWQRTQHNAVDSASQIHHLDRIVTIGGVLYADSKYRNTQERSYENVSVSVRSREGRAYREAIMCGYRQELGS